MIKIFFSLLPPLLSIWFLIRVGFLTLVYDFFIDIFDNLILRKEKKSDD